MALKHIVIHTMLQSDKIFFNEFLCYILFFYIVIILEQS